MIMKVDFYVPNLALNVSIGDVQLSLSKKGDDWQLDSEQGWHDVRLSLKGAVISEIATHKLP